MNKILRKIFNSIYYNIIKIGYKKILYLLNKRPKIKQKHKEKIIFIACIILICFFLYFIIFGLHYKFISKMPINKEKDKVKEKHKGVSIQNNPHINYDDFAKKLFKERKIIGFDYLNETLFGTKRDYSNFDNIHVLFAFNNEYYLLASVTITSILKTANNNSFIHIHIIASKGFEYETMKKLNSLKENINKNVEFIFYDGSKAEDDFGSQIKNEKYGVGEYAKLLGSILVDENVDRIIALDAGDLLIQRDLLELYNYPLDDYLVIGVIDPFAPCLSNTNIFFLKEGYLNAGVFLYNLKKWREMGIYNDI